MNELRSLNNISVQQLIDGYNKSSSAEVRRSSDLRPRMALRLSITLDTARTAENPYVISNPFNSFWVESTTSTSTYVQMTMGGSDKYNTDNPITLYANSSAKYDTAMKECQLIWAAQPGKVLNIIFFLGVDFRPGSFLTQLTGGVAIVTGSTGENGYLGSNASPVQSVSVTSGAQALLCDTDIDRKLFTFYTTQGIWIGGSDVTVGTAGILINAGERFQWTNTGQLYAIAISTTAVVTGVREG